MGSTVASFNHPSRAQILRWRDEGNVGAVRRAVRRRRWRRAGQLWVVLGAGLGRIVSPLLFAVLYVTLFLPFGLIGLVQRRPRGWLSPVRPRQPDMGAMRTPA